MQYRQGGILLLYATLLFLPPLSVGVNSEWKKIAPAAQIHSFKGRLQFRKLPYSVKLTGIYASLNNIVFGKETGAFIRAGAFSG